MPRYALLAALAVVTFGCPPAFAGPMPVTWGGVVPEQTNPASPPAPTPPPALTPPPKDPAADPKPAPAVVPIESSYPDDPRIAVVQKLLAGGDYEFAKNVLNEILKEHPKLARAEFFYGLTLTRLKRYEEARPRIENSVLSGQEFPERIHAPHFLGWASYHLGDLERAKKEFEAHVAAVPKSPDTIFGLGLIAFDEDRLDDAEKQFQASLDILIPMELNTRSHRRDVAKAWARLGDVSMRRGDLAKAEEQFMSALASFADHYEVWAKLARARDRLGKTKEADSARNEERRARERVGLPLEPVDGAPQQQPVQPPAQSPTPPVAPKAPTTPEAPSR